MAVEIKRHEWKLPMANWLRDQINETLSRYDIPSDVYERDVQIDALCVISVDRIADVLSALIAGVKVKPLDWPTEPHRNGIYRTKLNGTGIHYLMRVHTPARVSWWCSEVFGWNDAESEAAAKAAAQADYEARVLAALIAGVKVKPLEWDAPVRYGAKLEHMTTCRTYKVVEWGDASGHVLWFGQAGEPIRIDADGAAVGADVLKAAAQADYEARILAALEAAPVPDLVEAGKVAERLSYGVILSGLDLNHRDLDKSADTIRALIALATAQAAQIAGLEATIRKFQTVADDWECPLGVKGCAENCGNYGCGN